MKLRHKFVEEVPDQLEDWVLYVSLEYATAIHKCFCGCGNEVVTPLSPKEWKLIFDGETVSLYPSIGNWSTPCQSHYWITDSEVEWARKWSTEEIKLARDANQRVKSTSQKKHFNSFLRKLFKKSNH